MNAASHVKIGPIAVKYGIDVTGITHIGTNYGYEIHWYLLMGIPNSNIIGFEPLASAFIQFRNLYPNTMVFNVALGDTAKWMQLTVPAGDGQGATLLNEISKDPNTLYLQSQRVQVVRFDSLIDDYLMREKQINCAVIDVQGFEMQVLLGMGDRLKFIDLLSVELSDEPLYDGETRASDVCDYLVSQGFMQVTPIERHNDVFFVRSIHI